MRTVKSLSNGIITGLSRHRSRPLSSFGRTVDRIAEHLSFLLRRVELESEMDCAVSTSAADWPIDLESSFVFDIGAHEGDTIDYYLARGLRIVAVEPNPTLASRIRTRFADAVTNGRVFVEEACIVEGDDEKASFFVHRTHDRLSSILIGDDLDYDPISVSAISPDRLVEKYGYPQIVKVDAEGYDEKILSSFFSSQIFPIYVSAEIHSLGPVCFLYANGYQEFKIVEPRFVDSPRYKQVFSEHGHFEEYTFPYDSAGPIGEDIPGSWWTLDELVDYLTKYGYGWKDVHARRLY